MTQHVSIPIVLLQCQDVEVTIQPATAATDTLWALGAIRLSESGGRAGQLGLFAPQPSIEHLFRKPDKRPLEALSLLFAAVAALPLLGLVVGLYNCDVNLKVIHLFKALTMRSDDSNLEWYL